MTAARTRLGVGAAAVAIAGSYLAATRLIPSVAAGALLHPWRRAVVAQRPAGCVDAEFNGVGVTLKGWRCLPAGERRATLVFLHGIGDNRTSVAGAVDRFTTRGLEVVAYDSRAQGESTGDLCTYGFWEKRDLARVLDAVDAHAVVLLGTSLGAAVALQEAADDHRVIGVVAAEVFSDLRTVARERAPRLLTEGMIRRAFSIAELQGAFRIDDASPIAAARRITVPVLLIHGTGDNETAPAHSLRVLAALAGPKELLMVNGAGHNQSLRSASTWNRIDTWIDLVLMKK